jgi:hypothetical protein
MKSHVPSIPARTLGAKSEAKVGGTSSRESSPGTTEFSPLFEFTMMCKQKQQKTISDTMSGPQRVELKLGAAARR